MHLKFFVIFLLFLPTLGLAKDYKSNEALLEKHCSNNKATSAWHISNILDCSKRTLFIPYQLWTGAKWNGNKQSACMHKANLTFTVNNKSKTKITGPINWNGKSVWKREKINGSKIQYFACNKKGIGRVYDSRKPNRSYQSGRCKFPAGFGWFIGKVRKCTNTAIKIRKVTLNKKNELTGLEFDWFYMGSSGGLIHDHTYRYKVGRGMTKAIPR